MTDPATLTTAKDKPRRRTSRWRRLALVLVSLLGTLALIEIGTRVYLRLSGKPFDSAAARFEMVRLRSAANDDVPRLDDGARNDTASKDGGAKDGRASGAAEDPTTPYLNPFFAWEILGGAAMLESDLKWMPHSDYKKTYKLLLVGGSVAMMFGHYGIGPLIRELKKDPRFAGQRIYVQTYARGGFKEPQQVGVTNYLLSLGLEFQAVVCIDGFNEVALSNENVRRGANPIQPSLPHWGALASGAVLDREALDAAAVARTAQRATTSLATFALDRGVWHSAVASQLVLARLNRDAAITHSAFESFTQRVKQIGDDRVLHGPPFRGDARAGIESAVRTWEESSRSLRGICREHGIFYVHVLQPNVMDVRDRALTAEEIAADRDDSWSEGVHVGYPLLREAGRRLAAEGEVYVDATDVFDGESESPYFDKCHFAERGNELLAQRIAREFLKAAPR